MALNSLKRFLLLVLFVVCTLSFELHAQAYPAKGGLYSSCSASGSVCPKSLRRYNNVEAPLFRHYEDVRRYNAAPNPCSYRGVRREGFPPLSRDHVIFPRNVQAFFTDESSNHPATKVRTEVVQQRNDQVASYDANGCRTTRCMTVTIYRDVFCDGRTRIWQHVAFSN